MDSIRILVLSYGIVIELDVVAIKKSSDYL